jgi:hypothetical protein
MDGTVFGYIDGLLGAPDSYANYNCTLNAYKYFCDDLDSDSDLSEITIPRRGLFSAGAKNIRRYLLELGSEGLIFNYAVDACWEFPEGDFPWKAPDDFSPNANRPEAYRISVAEIDKDLYYEPVSGEGGGGITLLVDVYDWFNADSNEVKVECGDVFAPATSSTPVGGGEGFSTYQVDIVDAVPTSNDSLELFITVSCGEGYQDLLPGKVAAYYTTYIMEVPVGEPPFPCGDNLFEDNFDSYSNGSGLPSPWVNFWSGVSGYVTSEQYYSSPYCWRSSAFPYWARYDGIPMNRRDHFCYEARIMTTDPSKRALIGFAWKKTSSTTGHFCYLSIGNAYDPYVWHYVEAQIDCVENYWDAWVDGELVVDHKTWTDETAENTFTHFFIGCGNFSSGGIAVNYFDDVKLYWDE